jgi:hypothetical protein
MCWSLRPIPVVILARSISNFAVVPLAMSIGLTEIVPVILLVCPMIVSNGAFDSKVKTFRSSPMVKCVFAAHGLHGFAAHGLHGLAAHGLHGLHGLAAQGLHGLQGFAAHGLHGLHGFSASSLAHGLQGFSWWSANDTALRSVKLRNNVSVKMVKRCIIFFSFVTFKFSKEFGTELRLMVNFLRVYGKCWVPVRLETAPTGIVG